jgi:hypothetical protein
MTLSSGWFGSVRFSKPEAEVVKAEVVKVEVEPEEVSGDGMVFKMTNITVVPRLEGDIFVVGDTGGCVTVFGADGEKVCVLGMKAR